MSELGRTMWLLPLLCLVVGAGCEPTDFNPFYDEGMSFFSPADDGDFGKFSGLSFHPGGGSLLTSEYKNPYASESADLPLYTEEKPSPPLSKLGRDYKKQLHRASANLRPNYPPPNIAGYGSSGSAHQPAIGRIPRFRSEPFSAASNQEEWRQQSGKQFKNEAGSQTSGTSSYSKPVIQTGFVPIFKGQEKRTQSPSSSSILQDVPPPILTAESVSATARPTVFKVSASVSSSPKVPKQQQQHEGNASSTQTQDAGNTQRQAAYSRSLGNVKRVRVTSSESVVSRAVSKQSSVQQPTNQEPVPEESRLAAKKTLDLNCEGSRDLGWCELGDKYPKKYVDQVTAACQDVIQRMYVEVPHNFEKLSDTSDFKAQLNHSQGGARERGARGQDAWSWASYLQEGSLCDAETGFLRPETAKDSAGKWNIVVQTDELRQRVPIQMCRKTNGPCKKMQDCGLKSQCLQKYNYHLLLSLNPTQKHDCPFMKLYRFPSACVCHVE